MNLSEILRQITKSNEKNQFFLATVLSVNKGDNTIQCELIHNDLELTALLKPRLDNVVKGFIVYPEVDSHVLISLAQQQFYVMMFTEISSIAINSEKAKLELKEDGTFVFNDGGNDGIVKVKELVEQLNAIEDKYNSLIAKFNAHTHTVAALPSVGTPPPVIPTLVPVVPITGTLIKTTTSKIKNEKIKH